MYGQRAGGRWSVVSGRWPVDSGQWSVDSVDRTPTGYWQWSEAKRRPGGRRLEDRQRPPGSANFAIQSATCSYQ